jgi:hypothetical protein
VLVVVIHQNIRMSDAIASDILDSDHVPIVFHILGHVKTRNLSELVEEFIDYVRFRTSPRI